MSASRSPASLRRLEPDHDERVPCDLSPAQLAAWTFHEAAIDPPVDSLPELARSLGVARICENERLTKAGCLDVLAGQLVVQIRPGSPRWQRFTIAHELGHYLLAVHQGVPFATQTHNRQVERYCNSFASHLLLPRTWLRAEVRGKPQTLGVLLDVARLAKCTAAAALVALGDAVQWRATLAVWRRVDDEWRVQTCIRPNLPNVHLAPDEGTSEIFDQACSRVTRARVPVRVSDDRVTLDAQLRRFGPTVLCFAPVLASKQA